MEVAPSDLALRNSRRFYERAQHTIPGGVNSPARAFDSVGGTPLFIEGGEGAYLQDTDDHEYLDYVGSWGPMIFGHAHPDVVNAVKDQAEKSTSFGAPTEIEIEVAELVCDLVPSVEKVRMVNSGTEATMSAARLARGYTGRDKIIKFEGNYHGHGDFFLIAAGSGAMTLGEPDSPGVTKGNAKDTLLARYNDLDHVQHLVEANEGEVACIIVEPIAGNMGCIPPRPGFLEGLRELCDAHDIVLIFDEVMTGFRVAPGGAQERFGVIPDLTCLGKIIGGGLPVGAYGGKKLWITSRRRDRCTRRAPLVATRWPCGRGTPSCRKLPRRKVVFTTNSKSTPRRSNGERSATSMRWVWTTPRIRWGPWAASFSPTTRS